MSSSDANTVFISYSPKDSVWVRETLLPRLRAHAFDILIDTDFKAGAFGLQQIEKCVIDCRHVLAVLSPAYMTSDWGTLENVMAQCLDPAARARKLVPVLHKDCILPLRLKTIHYRDLTQPSDEDWERLVQDLL